MDDINKAFKESIIYYKTYALGGVQNALNACLPFLVNENRSLFLKMQSSFVDSLYKQIIFEICFFEYCKSVDKETMYSYIKERNNATVEDCDKMQYTRALNKLKNHQDIVYTHLGLNQEDIKEVHQNDTKVNYIYPFNKIQYEIMNLAQPLFYKLAKHTFSKNHNYSDMEAEKDLKLIDSVYDMIAEEKFNYFENCIQYYQLEIKYHIEAMYRFFMVAKEINRPIKDLKDDIIPLKRFWGEVNCVDNTDNHIIMGIDTLAEVYKEFPDELPKIMNFSLHINKIRKIIMRSYKLYGSLRYDINDYINCNEAENFFKNYIGMGQHIVREKDYANDINIKYFRKIY